MHFLKFGLLNMSVGFWFFGLCWLLKRMHGAKNPWATLPVIFAIWGSQIGNVILGSDVLDALNIQNTADKPDERLHAIWLWMASELLGLILAVVILKRPTARQFDHLRDNEGGFVCPRCGKPTDSHKKFCGQCGFELPEV